MKTAALHAFQRDQALYEVAVGEIIRHAPGGGVHIDCGAHAGQHSATMLERPDLHRVYGVEAIPRLCDYLDAVFAKDPRWRLVRAAVGREPGTAMFHEAADAPGYSGLKRRDLPAVRRWESFEVPVVRLDDMVDTVDRDRVGLIKLDLEGGEFDALRGARALLASSAPLVVFENGLRNSADGYGYGWDDFDALFSGQGYEVHDFFGERVTRAYWEATLQTYMFVAARAGSAAARWRESALPALVEQCMAASDSAVRPAPAGTSS